jgi:hypothetical protein
VLLISSTGINAIDATGLHAISTLQRTACAPQGRTLAFCGLKKQVIDADGAHRSVGTTETTRPLPHRTVMRSKRCCRRWAPRPSRLTTDYLD